MTDSASKIEGSSTNRLKIQQLLDSLSQEIIGQEFLLKRMLITLLAEGHLLVVGAPGLAKTTAVKALATRLEGSFHRIQFTPDLLPSDLTGTDIYRPQQNDFNFQEGPLFNNFLLADEINRAPAKVQSALLEAMAENQITVGKSTYPLPQLFMVMATQNPIEQEGTYPLPEAQLDRFLMEVNISYPAKEDEQKILQLIREQRKIKNSPTASLQSSPPLLVNQETIFTARDEIFELHFSSRLEEYVVELVAATRNPGHYDPKLQKLVRFGASPRGTIALEHCARAHAWLNNQDYVSPEDIHAVAPDVLRHRIIMSYEAIADGISTDEFIATLLKLVTVP